MSFLKNILRFPTSAAREAGSKYAQLVKRRRGNPIYRESGDWYCEYCKDLHSSVCDQYEIATVGYEFTDITEVAEEPKPEDFNSQMITQHRHVCIQGRGAIKVGTWSLPGTSTKFEVDCLIAAKQREADSCAKAIEEFAKGRRTTKPWYVCDPAKNTSCKKTFCMWLGKGDCSITSHKEYSKNGIEVNASTSPMPLVEQALNPDTSSWVEAVALPENPDHKGIPAEFVQTCSGPCDPEKNTECEKTACKHLGLGGCAPTSHKEYSVDLRTAETTILDQFMNAVRHCDTLKVVLTGIGEETFDTQEVWEAINAVREKASKYDNL